MQIDGYGSGHLDNWASTKKDIFIHRYMNDLTDQELFLVRERQIDRIFSDNTSVNRFVISQAILSCLNLIYDNWTNESELYSINTTTCHS